MVSLPNDLNYLNKLLIKQRINKQKALKALDHFEKTERSEFYDNFVAKFVEEAKQNGKTKDEIDQIKKSGQIKADAEFLRAYEKKEKEVRLNQYSRDIKNIKEKITIIENNSENSLSDSSSDNVQIKVQNRFEFNF